MCNELYRSQQYATAIYRSELALRLNGQGYEIERGKSGQPEIVGYTPEYLDASSPRSQQIQAYLEQQGVKGAGAAQISKRKPNVDPPFKNGFFNPEWLTRTNRPMTGTRIRLSRPQLDQKVWTIPMRTPAEHFGLSDVGWAKTTE